LVPKGKEIAQKAIRLDPTLADGYIAMGMARMNFDWDWAGAEKDLKKALELNPNSALALDTYTNFLAIQGRFDEAVMLQKRALELDPLSAGLWHDLGWIYFESGQFNRAIPHLRKALELDRNLHMSRHELGLSYLWTGKTAEALAEHQILAQLAPNLPWVQGALGYFYALTGRHADAKNVLTGLDQLARKRYVPCWARAIVYLGLGQKSAALDWLEKAVEEHDGWIWDLNVCPWYDSLRNEPRFQVLLKKVGFGK
jgi:serine/threonine-protein kinase